MTDSVRKIDIQILPDYTIGEEIFNTITHIVGGVMSIVMIVLGVIKGTALHNPWIIVTGSVYGFFVFLMFTISSLYHGLPPCMGKKVLRIIDHCDIYLCIAGTYTPILLVAIRPLYSTTAWIIFGIEWGLAILGIILNAVDMDKFEKISFVIYLGMGWCIILGLTKAISAMSLAGFMWLLAGGIAFSLGAAFYLMHSKIRYMHSIFHILVDVGVLLQFFSIFFFVFK
ncbi:MAG: hemolysin III family protein [Synergistaceae bacterium]|nr:hemolysin III family protein [Synergistaceae bacterium]